MKERLLKYNSNEKETPLNDDDTYIGDTFGSNVDHTKDTVGHSLI